MYFKACERLAEDRPQWRETIESIDGFLQHNAGKSVFVDTLVAHSIGTDRTVRAVVGELTDAGLLRELALVVCPEHRGNALTPDSSGRFRCDLCGEFYESDDVVPKDGLAVMEPIKEPEKQKVFVSHSSADKPFVERLVHDLEAKNLDVWFDKSDIGVGDSIPTKINEGLASSEYVIVVLSSNSISSKWVEMELNAALMAEAGGDETVVIPIKLDDCEIPPLIKHKLYADFSADYDVALNQLLEVFELETTPGDRDAERTAATCEERLTAMRQGELRRRLCKLGRPGLRELWFDVLGTDMDDDHMYKTLGNCAMELLLASKRQDGMSDLYAEICASRRQISKRN